MELNRAFQSTLTVLGQVRPDQLGAPTPCASWDVRALVNHFIGAARWWAVTIAEDGEVGEVDYAAGDFVAAYEESIRIAIAAFEAEGALQKTVRLPFGEFPGAVLLGLAATEQVHPWLGPGARHRALHRPGSRVSHRAAPPGPACDHRCLPRG